ncbi:MAG: hypothetical protein JSW50_05425 [Candidatus Latescibacterota bacterium]|nr:MAG: hypothetical protein JSW50_05425 [Candidatus Latescibacterota bacterium]
MTRNACVVAKLVLLLVVLSAVVWGAGGEEPDAKRLVRHYLDQTAENPKATEGWVRLSEAYLWLASDTGDLDQIANADSAVASALALAPVDVPALNQLSRVRSAQHRFEDVLHIQRESIYYGLMNAESWGIVGDAYMDLGRYRSADSCYYAMFELDPDFGSLMRVARRMFDIGDYAEAVLYANAAIDTAWRGNESHIRELADAHVRLGRMKLSRGDLEWAMVWSDSSLAVVPGYGPALELRAVVHRLRGRFEQAKSLYRQLVDVSADPRFVSGLARVYAESGDDETADSLVHAASETYKRLLGRYPGIVRRSYIEFLLDWDRDVERAQQLAFKESRTRKDVNTYDLLAWAYYKNGNYNLAWSSIALALRRDAQHPKIIYHAAVIAKAAGKRDEYLTYSARIREMNRRYEAMYGSL